MEYNPSLLFNKNGVNDMFGKLADAFSSVFSDEPTNDRIQFTRDNIEDAPCLQGYENIHITQYDENIARAIVLADKDGETYEIEVDLESGLTVL